MASLEEISAATKSKESRMNNLPSGTAPESSSNVEDVRSDNCHIKRVIIDDEDDDEEESQEISLKMVKMHGLAYHDHNYDCFPRSATHHREDSNAQPFPIMGGLASYLEEMCSSTNSSDRGHFSNETENISNKRHSVREPFFRRLEHASNFSNLTHFTGQYMQHRSVQNIGSNFVTIGGRTYVRQPSSVPPYNYRSASKDVISTGVTSNASCMGQFGGRRLRGNASFAHVNLSPIKKPAKTGILNDANTFGRSHLAGGCVNSPTMSSSKSISTSLPAYISSVNAASIAADPMRAANDNAPAPFIVPARNSRSSIRSKVQAGRGRGREREQPDQNALGGFQKLPIASQRKVDGSSTVAVVTTTHGTSQHQFSQHLGPSKSQYVMAEPVEPCHVPQIEHSARPSYGMRCVEEEGYVYSEVGDAVNSLLNDNVDPQRIRVPSIAAVDNQSRDTTAIRRVPEVAVDTPQRLRSSTNAFNGANSIYSDEQRSSTVSPYLSSSQRNIYHPNILQSTNSSVFVSRTNNTARGVRQVPISPGHVAGIFSQQDINLSQQNRNPISLPQQFDYPLQQSLTTSAQPNIHFQQYEQVTNQERRFVNRQDRLTHLGSPEQRFLIQQHMYGSRVDSTSHIAENVNYITQHHPATRVAHENEQKACGSEISSEGNGIDISAKGYLLSHQPSSATRNSLSAAEEEETSLTEDVTEEKGTEEEGDGKVSSISLSGSRSRAENADDEWNEDYTTRCYCGLDHNDDFMIQCDICNVWQHGKCMGVDQRRIPKVYKCEECYPRTLKLTKAQAYELQNKILLQLRHGKNVIQKRNRKNSGTTQKRTKVKKAKKEITVPKSLKSFIETNINEYSRGVLAFSRKETDTDDAYVVELVCSNRDVRSMFVVASCTGLVADRAFSRNEPVMYLSGRICLQNECIGREKPGTILPFVFLYSNLILNGEEIPICVDARRTGSITRYVRRSCTPNLFLKHVFCGGKLHIIGFAQCSIDRLDELTVPFDSDYQLSILSLTCACASSFEEEDDVEVSLCKIKNFNRKLKMKSLISGEVATEYDMKKTQERKAKRIQRVDGRGRPRTSVSGINIKVRSNTQQTDSSAQVSVTSTDVEHFGHVEHNIGSTSKRKGEIKSQSKKKKLINSKIKKRSKFLRKKGSIKLKRCSSKIAASLALEERDVLKSFPKVGGNGYSGIKHEPDVKNEENVEDANNSVNDKEFSMILPNSKDTILGNNSVLESFSCKNEVSKGESPNRCNVINPEKNENDVEKAFNEDCDHAADEWNNPPEKEESPLKIEQHGAVSKKHGECNKNEADNMLHCQRMQKKLGLFSPDEMNYTLPEDRNKTVTREERKLQQQVALFERQQADAQRKEVKRLQQAELKMAYEVSACKRRHSISSPAKSKVDISKLRGRSSFNRCDEKVDVNFNENSTTSNLNALECTAIEKDEEQQEEEPNISAGDNLETCIANHSSTFKNHLQFETNAAPPRKRWASTAAVQREHSIKDVHTAVISGLGGTSGAGCSFPAEVGRKAWLLQRAQKTQDDLGDQFSSPAEKRSVLKRNRSSCDSSPGVNESNRDYALERNVEIKQAETSGNASGKDVFDIRAQFDRIAAADIATGSSEFSLGHLNWMTADAPSTSSAADDIISDNHHISLPKKKMSLDEYKKRKGTVKSNAMNDIKEEKKSEQTTAVRTSSRSFIPVVNENESTVRRPSLKLGALPDPSQIRVSSNISIDDLKRRIYGKPSSSCAVQSSDSISPSQLSKSVDAKATSEHKENRTYSRTPPPPPPPFDPPPSLPKRMSLEERLRLVLGCGSLDTGDTKQDSNASEINRVDLQKSFSNRNQTVTPSDPEPHLSSAQSTRSRRL